jgi:hypothetical protein
MNNERSVKLEYRGNPLLGEGEKGFIEFHAGCEANSKWKLRAYIRNQTNLDTLIVSGKPNPVWHLIRLPISGMKEGETMDIGLFAENVDGKEAINYWADFKVVKGE